jgi:iron complex transport system ATP-binding protein
MKHGAIVAQGRPTDVVDAALVEDVFGLACQVVPDPVSGTPLVVPRSRHHGHGLTSEAESPAAV